MKDEDLQELQRLAKRVTSWSHLLLVSTFPHDFADGGASVRRVLKADSKTMHIYLRKIEVLLTKEQHETE